MFLSILQDKTDHLRREELIFNYVRLINYSKNIFFFLLFSIIMNIYFTTYIFLITGRLDSNLIKFSSFWSSITEDLRRK